MDFSNATLNPSPIHLHAQPFLIKSDTPQMMNKTVILLAHPNLGASITNRIIANRL